MNFDDAFHKLLGHEGAYSNHPLVPERRGDLLHGLTAAKPEFYCVSTAPKDGSPLRKRFAFASEFVLIGGSEVVRLLKRCRPSDVSRFIAAVIVYAVNCCPRGRLPHVLEKRVKAVKPLIADLYAAATPKVIASVIRVVASVFHGGPSGIGAAFPKPMGAHLIAELLIVKAPARSGGTAPQFVCSHKALLAAIAHALPPSDWATVGVRGVFAAANNYQTPKALP